MSTDIDPASEALVRQLHRELNGLTRSARRGDTGHTATGLQQPYKRRPVRTTAPSTTASAKQEYTQQQQQPSNQSQLQAPLPAQKTTSHERATAPGAASKRRARLESASPSTGEDEAEGGTPTKKQRPERRKDSGVDEPEPVQNQRETKDQWLQRKSGADLKRNTVPAKVEPEQAAGTSVQVAEQPPAPAPTSARSPLEAAAAAASAAVRQRAKACIYRNGASGASTDDRHVKCFYAGVRWGITLPPDVLKSRSDLAAALNEAFEGEIVSCGRGERLTVIFLDADGVTSELPSLRLGGGKESATKWRSLAQRAHKLYVRPAI